MSFATLGRYWHTLRPLKPIQFWARARLKLARPRPETGRAPARRIASGPWVTPARRAPSLTGPATFRFLNQDGALADLGWDDPAQAKLWRYNQHYFDDLNAAEPRERAAWHAALIADWIAANPPASGTGWEPYPTALRIVNWIKAAQGGLRLSDDAVHSLAVQARWLARRIEWHLLGNHLFADAKALVFAGLFFDGPEAAGWLDTGAAILAQQLPEQILGDGGQFELSPMYHALALEDVLDLIDALRRYPGQAPELLGHCKRRVPLMLDWLAAMRHPDGDIAFFNDAAFAIAPSPGELIAYAERLGFAPPAEKPGITHLPATNYIRAVRGPAVLIADLAQIGPSYLPGHAHADNLSLELSLSGRRLLVNSGTSEYGTGLERLRQRGTAAHNTVRVDGRDSSDVWSAFRVGCRARTFAVECESTADESRIAGAHDGYRFLARRPVHRREWRLGENGLCVTDLLGDTRWPARAFYHLHPDVIPEIESASSGTLRWADGKALRWSVPVGTCQLVASSWHPEFGLSIPSHALAIDLVEGQAQLELVWA